MTRFCVQGVVRGGQVVLDIPLDLPDGTSVVVTDHEPEDAEIIGPPGRLPPEVIKRLLLGAAKRLDLLDDPEWEAKLRGGQ
jgi:Flp pilus assembly CpaE family ATPase